MRDKPWLWLLAGPNGAGKSTCVATLYDLSPEIVEVVNADNIARNLMPEAPERAALRRAAWPDSASANCSRKDGVWS
jgi:predicted ABC-type ATPase